MALKKLRGVLSVIAVALSLSLVACGGGGGGGDGAAAADSGTPSSIPTTPDWVTEADEYPGATGTRYTITLPAGGKAYRIWGVDTYTDDSSIGTAAVHAGLITFAAGGTVSFEIRDGQSSYTGSTRNGVTTASWPAWPRSFVFVTP